MDNRSSSTGIVISEEVVAKIVNTAVLEVEGVADVVPRPADLKGIFSNRSSQAVHVDMGDNDVSIDVFLKLKMGAQILEVCKEAQLRIKDAVQNMTGKVVTKVNVNVVDVEIEKEEEK